MRRMLVVLVVVLSLPGLSFAERHSEPQREVLSIPQSRTGSHERDTHDGRRDSDSEREQHECKKPVSPSPLLQGLVSYWKLDGTSVDSVGGNNGTDTSIAYGAPYGVLGQGAFFDGIASGIGFEAPANLSLTGDMSIAMWVYPLDMAEAGSVFAKTVGGGASDNTYDLAIFDDAPMQMVYANGTYYYIDSAASLPSHTWSHVVYTRGNGNTETHFYINGVDAGLSNDHWAAITPLTGGNVYMGRRGNGNFFHGYIDEVGVWNRVLTPAEASLLYNAGSGRSYPF